ncbi:hypothetical protein L0128_18895 [candidate division KSB1 bacterium]|nr:hypothetical protein [candidate division KSB1 bacterium]
MHCTRRLHIGWLLIGISLNLPAFLFSQKLLPLISRLAPGQNQVFMLTNSGRGFYFGHTGGTNQLLAEGFNVQNQEYLDDYLLKVNDEILDRQTASVEIYPDRIRRYYARHQLSEEIHLDRQENLLIITLRSQPRQAISCYPLISEPAAAQAYIVHWQENDHLLFLARKKHLIRSTAEDYPVWLGMATLPEPVFVPEERTPKSRPSGLAPDLYWPGRFSFQIDSVAVILFMVSDLRHEISNAKRRIEGQYQFLIETRGNKIEEFWQPFFEKSAVLPPDRFTLWFEPQSSRLFPTMNAGINSMLPGFEPDKPDDHSLVAVRVE